MEVGPRKSQLIEDLSPSFLNLIPWKKLDPFFVEASQCLLHCSSMVLSKVKLHSRWPMIVKCIQIMSVGFWSFLLQDSKLAPIRSWSKHIKKYFAFLRIVITSGTWNLANFDFQSHIWKVRILLLKKSLIKQWIRATTFKIEIFWITDSLSLTRFFGPGKNIVKGKPHYRRSILVLKPKNGEYESSKFTFSLFFYYWITFITYVSFA